MKGDDTLNATGLTTLIDAGDGNDVVTGGTDDDALIGGDGDDPVDGGRGDYDLVGGAGENTLIYTSISRGTVVDLGAASDHAIGAEINADQISSVENVIAGLGDDFVRGNNGSNRLEGMDGNDQIFDGSGADVVIGGLGNDYLRVVDVVDSFDGGSGTYSLLWRIGR